MVSVEGDRPVVGVLDGAHPWRRCCAGFAYRWLRGEVTVTRVVTAATQTVGTGAAAEEAVIKRK